MALDKFNHVVLLRLFPAKVSFSSPACSST
jgi:hypothetical protein